MSEASDGLAAAPISEDHRAALRWFLDRTGQEVPWPERLPNGTFLATRAKGIHKPKGWDHSLSVRESIIDWYPDRGPSPEKGAASTTATIRRETILSTSPTAA